MHSIIQLAVFHASSLYINLLRLLAEADWQVISDIATSLALVATLFLFYEQRRVQNKMLRIQYLIQAQEKYDAICKIRSENPDFVLIAKNWTLKDFEDMTDRERAYYHYVEITLGFIETYVYLAFVAKVIPKKMFSDFIEPMMWLELRHNTPAFHYFSNARSISQKSCEFLNDLLGQIGSKNDSAADYESFNQRRSRVFHDHKLRLAYYFLFAANSLIQCATFFASAFRNLLRLINSKMH
jgi:hypothetical protein